MGECYPRAMSDSFEWAVMFVLDHEGGYVNDPNDPGGETKYGISKASYPGLDIANLTIQDAKDIYQRDYWLAVGADEMPMDIALAVFDFAVNAGVARANRFWLSTGNYRDFMAERLRFYTRLTSLFPKFGRGWVNRTADLLDYTSALMGLSGVKRLFIITRGGMQMGMQRVARASKVDDKLYVKLA